MMLVKKFTNKQVLEVIATLVLESLPEGMKGDIHAAYDEEDGIEVTFLQIDGEKPQS